MRNRHRHPRRPFPSTPGEPDAQPRDHDGAHHRGNNSAPGDAPRAPDNAPAQHRARGRNFRSDARPFGSGNRAHGPGANQRNGPRHGGPYHPRPNGGDASQDHRRHGNGGGEIVFGVEPIRELLAVAPRAIRTLYFKAGAHPRFASEIEAVRAAGGNIVSSADDALARMAGSEGRHQGLVAAIREYAYTELEQMLEERPDPVVVIDGVTDPRNLGAILRSAEGAGVRAAVIARDRTSGLTPAAVKASAGAWAHLKVARCGNVAQTLEALKAVGYWTAALAPEGDVSVYELDVTRRLALVLGSEGQGVRELVKKTADFVVGIPMYGRVASLNVSVAAAIALFELARRRGVEPSSKMPQ